MRFERFEFDPGEGALTRDEVHLWANTFDRPPFGLDVQGELAEHIAQSVAAQLTAR